MHFRIGLLTQELSMCMDVADSLNKFQCGANMFEDYLESESHSSSDVQENDLFPKNDKHDQSSGSTENTTM